MSGSAQDVCGLYVTEPGSPQPPSKALLPDLAALWEQAMHGLCHAAPGRSEGCLLLFLFTSGKSQGALRGGHKWGQEDKHCGTGTTGKLRENLAHVCNVFFFSLFPACI